MIISIIKIQNVRSLKQSMNYILQDHKTREYLISSYGCDRHFAMEDFQQIYEERKTKWNRGTKNKAKMLIQSFNPSDEVSPELAHQIGKEYAENYLEGKHQYIIATHIDSDNIHNHIIFNQVETDSLKMFNTKRAITNTKLHKVNNELSEKYELTIPSKQKRKMKLNNMSQREVEVRRRGRSFKAEIEETIDQVIDNSNSYKDFLKEIQAKGYEIKDGMYLSIQNKKTSKFMRTQTLGINYTKNSMKYRIDNKDFKPVKNPYTIKNKEIDKNQSKYRDNKGLRRWASKQNIKYLQEISNLVINKGMSLEEIEEINLKEEKFYKKLEKSLSIADKELHELEQKQDAFDVYKSYDWMISDYKGSDDPEEFKREHYKEFKAWDKATYDMRTLKNKYGIQSKKDLEDYQRTLKDSRSEEYQLYSHFNKPENIAKEKTKEKTKEKEINKRRRR